MIRKACFLFLTLTFSVNAIAKNLCLQTEDTIFSFETKSKKVLSICKGTNGSYLAYKFGSLKNIEFQFPDKLDITSWKQFDFSGMSRGVGK
jgi:hypothetical protein